jgi:transposase
MGAPSPGLAGDKIGLLLGISRSTVYRHLRSEAFPERGTRRNAGHSQVDPWLRRALRSTLRPLRNFARHLSADYDAVQAAAGLDGSNGPVEGHINRLKMLKRTMYGRAGLDLLGRRFLLAA